MMVFPTHARPHILIVDDYQPMREIVKIGLEQHGYRVSEADKNSDALREAKTLMPDLILLDLAIRGGGNRIQIATALHRELPRVPLVVLTTYVDDSEKLLRGELEKIGVAALVSKGTGLATLADLVEKVLTKSQSSTTSNPVTGSKVMKARR